MSPQAHPTHPKKEKHHRNISRGIARAAVFGVSDGLVSNTSLILGVAGALTEQSSVRLAGMAGLLAGAISMAFGEYISMRAQRELYERELERERHEHKVNAESEISELAEIYRERGARAELAEEMARVIMSDSELALEVHAREELGIDPKELGSPIGAAASSLLFFALGAICPLLPWFFGGGTQAVLISIGLAAFAASLVGAFLAEYTSRPYMFSILRQLLITAAAAGITFGIGSAIGVSVA